MSANTRHPLAQAPLDELTAELDRRRAALPRLVARRDRLITEIEMVNTQIDALERLDGASVSKSSFRSIQTPKTAGGKSGRVTMRVKILEILATDPMRPSEIAEALVDRGLHSGTKSLKIQVSSTLAKYPDFQRISRGQWVRKVATPDAATVTTDD